MAKYCSIKPDRGEHLFEQLKEQYGYDTAWNLWALSTVPSFNEEKHFRRDSEGFPLMEDLVNDKEAIKIMGEESATRGMEKKFPVLDDTRANYSRLINAAQEFNAYPNNKRYIAIVDENEDGKLKVYVKMRTQTNERIANDQYATETLNNRLSTQLGKIGITIDDITEAEKAAGRVGVTDFTVAKELASDCSSVIRVANNLEGHRVLSEEFSHLVIGAYRDMPIIQRALAALHDMDTVKAILGDEFIDNYDFQDGDLDLLAEEALGKLLRDNLLAETSGAPRQARYIIDRAFNNIKSRFKKLDATAIDKAIIEADSLIGQLAKNILNGQVELQREKIANTRRDVQFNALSDRIQANIDILKKLRDVEIKRYRISPKATAEEIEAQKKRIRDLQELTEGEKDTRIGILNYCNQALEDLKGVEESMTRKTYTGTPSFATLRRARSYIQSYSSFIEDMGNAILDAENDEECPNFLKEIELEDGTVVSMMDSINELKNLSDDLVRRYNKYARAMITEFFRPFYGDTLRFTAGSRKGENLNIEQVIKEASQDISFLDLWIDTMSDSSDVFLQLFDAVAKKANDNARTLTIADSKEITRLRLIAEENGITDYEWMFEKNSKGHKTGNYISEYNQGLFDEAKEEFANSLDALYGKNPKGEEAKMKVKALRDWNKEYAEPGEPNKPKAIAKWRNAEYDNMMASPAKRELYEGFMRLKGIADSQYPDTRVSQYKAIQRRKSSGNRLIEAFTSDEGLITSLKEAVKQTFLDAEDDDQIFGNKKTALANFSGTAFPADNNTEYMALPVLYTTRLRNPDELSTDIFSDLLVYKYSANVYSEMDKIVDPLEVAKSWVMDGNRKVSATRGDNQVVEKISAMGDKVVNKIYKGNTNMERKLSEWMESHIYQRYMKDEGTIGSTNINISKTGNWLLSASSMAQLGFNWLANTANVLTGIGMINIEAAAHEYFNASQLADADKAYFANMGAFMAELGSRNKTNFISLFDEFFNIKADYSSNVKRNQKKGLLQKLFGEEIAYIGQDGGDHWMYNRVAMAYVKSLNVLVPKIVKTVRKVKGIKDALNTLDKIVENSQFMHLTDDESHYKNDHSSEEYARVTTMINAHNDSDTFSEAWKTPSTNIGTGIDELVRDFFSGFLAKDDDGKWHHDNKGDDLLSIYPNISEKDMSAFLDQLTSLKEEFDSKGLSVVSRDIVARGSIKVNDNGTIRDLKVAGTLDLLVYDKSGNFYIYDMKTHRGAIKNTTKQKWSYQLSLYKRFLEEEYGITVKGLNIIPIRVSYDTPEGEMSGGEEGAAKYEVVEGTHQLLQDGKEFKGAAPSLDKIIPLTETKKIPIEYDNLGYNKQFAKVTDIDGYEQMSLFDALQVENVYSDRSDIKQMVIPEGTLDAEGLPIDKDKISRIIQDINIHMFGAYDEENSSVANRIVAGRAIMQMRKWIKPQFNLRFQKAQLNLVTGKTREGYYRTAGKFLAKKFLGNFMNESLRGKIQIAENWNELSDEEKSNVRRAVFEIIQCLCVYMLATYAPWPDDKNRPWALKYAEYMAQRELHELGMLTPSLTQVQEVMKTVKSPASVLSSVSSMLNLAHSVLSPEDWVDEKQSGSYKGMSTLEANFLKAPIYGVTWYRQIDKFAGELDNSIQYYARPGI